MRVKRYGPWEIMMEADTWAARIFWFRTWIGWRLRCLACKYYELRYPWFYRELGDEFRGYYPVNALKIVRERLLLEEHHE